MASRRRRRPVNNRRGFIQSSAKPSARRASPKSALPSWAYVVVGLAVGSAMMAVTYRWYTAPPASPEVALPLPPPVGTSTAPKAVAMIVPPPTIKPEAKPKELPAANRFDFYDVLPNQEKKSLAPGRPLAVTSANISAPTPVTAPEKTPRYILQAGAFRNIADADKVKVKLAFQGIESTVQAGTGSNHQSLYRVRIGPVTGQSAVDSMRQRLRAQGITPLVVKSPD